MLALLTSYDTASQAAVLMELSPAVCAQTSKVSRAWDKISETIVEHF